MLKREGQVMTSGSRRRAIVTVVCVVGLAFAAVLRYSRTHDVDLPRGPVALIGVVVLASVVVAGIWSQRHGDDL